MSEQEIRTEDMSSVHFEYAADFLQIEKAENDPSLYIVSFQPNLATRPHIHGPLHFWRETVRALRVLTEDNSWIIRYASQVDAQNLPAAKSTATNIAVFDPLAPYRSVVKALLIGGKVTLKSIDAPPYFFKSRDAVQETAEARRASRSARNAARSYGDKE